MSHLLCKCGWEGPDEEVETTLLFAATRVDPAEYQGRCLSCRRDWTFMKVVNTEVVL